jgi:uncharacterized protein (TIGR02145 family)
MKTLLFLGALALSLNSFGQVDNTIKIGNLEIYGNDLGEMSWDNAKQACADLGDGWRLPTFDELYLLCQDKDNIGGFSPKYYWSSASAIEGVIYFDNCYELEYFEGTNGYVRPVRTYNKDGIEPPSSNEVGVVVDSTSEATVPNRSVIIDGQEWMLDNLNVNSFSNGDSIIQALSIIEWMDAYTSGTPAWCYYDFDIENGIKYGKMYNIYAFADNRGIAPVGWRITTSDDWDKLRNASDGYMYGVRTINGWDDVVDEFINGYPNSTYSELNTTGFSATPGGRIYGLTSNEAHFTDLNNMVCFWEGFNLNLRTSNSLPNWIPATVVTISDRNMNFFGVKPKRYHGAYVRCIKL